MKVIMISGYRTFCNHASRLGADYIMSRRMSADEIINKIRMVMEKPEDSVYPNLQLDNNNSKHSSVARNNTDIEKP